MVTRLRSRGDNGRLHTSPNRTSSVSVARPGAIRRTGPDGRAGACCGDAVCDADVRGATRYRSSVTFSIQCTFVPSRGSVIAMCVIDVFAEPRASALVGRDPHNVSRLNVLDAMPPLLDSSCAGRDNQDLARGMRMPGCACAWFECDGPSARGQRSLRLEQGLDSGGTCEVLAGAWRAGRDSPRVMISVCADVAADVSSTVASGSAIKHVISVLRLARWPCPAWSGML